MTDDKHAARRRCTAWLQQTLLDLNEAEAPDDVTLWVRDALSLLRDIQHCDPDRNPDEPF